MTLSSELINRSQSKCEFCHSTDSLNPYQVSPKLEDIPQNQIAICQNCNNQISEITDIDVNHWRCLNEAIWSEVDAVKVVSYRMLNRLKDHDWASDLLGMMYLEEATLEWAEHKEGGTIIHKDSNGNILETGDTVTLIQDLNVKGASFTAKRGTAVRRIRLVHDNAEHIEGKIDGQHIVILTKFVKKSS